MQQSDNISPQAPSLPKGGGALTGLSGQAALLGGRRGVAVSAAARQCRTRLCPFSLTQLQQSGR